MRTFLAALFSSVVAALQTGVVVPTQQLAIVRAEPGSYLLCKQLAGLAVGAFYGEHAMMDGPLAYAQRAVITENVLQDLSSRLKFYEEARDRELPHVGAVLMVEDRRTGNVLGFADVGVHTHDRDALTFLLPKRPEGADDGPGSCERRPYISNLAVSESARRRGVGRFLMEACEREARTWGDDAVWLEVSLSNTGGQAFYEQLGYLQEASTRGREVIKKQAAPFLTTFESNEVERRLLRKPLVERSEGEAQASGAADVVLQV